MKTLAAQEMWARRLAEREELFMGVTTPDLRRRIVLALCEAYSTGYHDAMKETIGKLKAAVK